MNSEERAGKLVGAASVGIKLHTASFCEVDDQRSYADEDGQRGKPPTDPLTDLGVAFLVDRFFGLVDEVFQLLFPFGKPQIVFAELAVHVVNLAFHAFHPLSHLDDGAVLNGLVSLSLFDSAPVLGQDLCETSG